MPSETTLTISFTLEGSTRHMLREQGEELGKVLARISNNIVKSRSKGKKSKRGEGSQDATEPQIRLYFNGDCVSEDLLNSDAWQDGAVLHVGDTKFKVERNPPTFTTAELPASILSGFPVCPKLEIEFGDLKDCLFTWYKEGTPSDPSADPGWMEVGQQQVFTPSNLDIGVRLKLKCTPGNESRYGVAKELVSSGAVEAGPGVCTFNNRHMYTKKVTEASTVRVVSYNILADVYAQTELSKTVLYPYCAPYALGLDYRQSLIKKELTGYNADIICLQEVDKGAFSDSLVPALDAFGMDGVFRMKEKQHEGLATFYRRSKFKLIGQHDITLSEALTTDAIHSEILDAVSTNPTLREKVVQRSTALQVLRPKMIGGSRFLTSAQHES